MADLTPIEVARPVTPEAAKPPTRLQVTRTLGRVFNDFQGDSKKVSEKRKSTNQMTGDEAKVVVNFTDFINNAEQSGAVKRDKKTGVIKEITWKDGMVVDGLVNYVSFKIDQLQKSLEVPPGNLSPKDIKEISSQLAKLKEDQKIIDSHVEVKRDADEVSKMFNQEQTTNAADFLQAIVTNASETKDIKPIRKILKLPEAEKKPIPAPEPVITPEPVTVTPEPVAPKPTPPEEIDPSYFDSGTRHEHPFLEDLIDDPSSPRLKDLKDNLEKKQKGELYANQEVVDNMDIVEKLLKDEKLQTLFPKKDNESDTAYRTRTLQNLMGRLRFHGDYQVKKDPIYAYFQQNLIDTQGRPYQWDEVLMGTEALNTLDIQARNEVKTKEYDQYLYNLNQSARRRSVLTEVDLLADERYPGGGLQPYLTKDAEGKTVREKMPQADLAAFEVVGTVLMDIQDPTLGKDFDGRAYTYSEVFKHHQEIVLNASSTQEQKDNASKRLSSYRETFYVKTLDILKHRESHNPYREGEDQSAFGQKAFARLQELTAGKSPDQAQEALIAAYKTSYEAYHGRPLTPAQEARVKNIISTPEQPGITQDIMDLAIKGGEFMRRRVEKLREPPKLEKVPLRIFRKKFKEAGVYRGPVYVEETPVTVTPPEKEGEGKTPEGAPVGEGEGEPGEGKNPEGAPISEEPPVVPPPELAKEFNVAAVADKSRIEQEIGGLAQHDRAREKPARGFIRSLLTPITNPREFIRNVVQNTFLKGTFDARSMSFSRSITEIARTKHAGLDSSIPFEMPQEILDKAIEEGRKIKRKNIINRVWNEYILDLPTGLLGIYQNSDMRYARKWFAENGKPLVDQAKQVSLSEQTQLGEKFALEGKNEDIISKDLGETRYRLDELITDKTVRDGFQGKIKELIGKYAQKQLNDEQLLKEFNLYYHKEVLPKIPADKQKELEGIEVSSNILRIGHEMLIEDVMTTGEKKTRYQRYQDETTEDGKKKWDELELRIYLGQGKYETARGEVRLSGLEKKLIHRMVERDYKLSNGLVLNGAVETLKDIGIYGSAYLVGGLSGSAVMAGRSVFHVGGLIATPVMAGAREGVLFSKKGKLYGIRGKSVTDFEQVSRELAQGRASMDKAKLRPMFEKAMVDQRSAGELTSPIISLLNKESLNEAEQKKLMMEIAHAKARLHLSDLSTQKGKGFLQVSVAQNFVGYTEGKQNQEMTSLRAAIVQGVSKLSQSNPQLYGKMQQAQSVYEAQLKVGSVQNKLGRVVSIDTGLSQADAQNIVSEYYSDLGIDTTAGKSLEKAAFTLAKVVDRRAATTFAFAAVVSPIIGAELKLIQMPFTEMAAIHNEGFSGWSADWHQVLSGEVPLKIDNNGQLISDLSAAQKATLWTHNTLFEPPPGIPHDTMIDGVKVQLPGAVEHGHVAGNPNADALVDIRSGKVLVDMSQTKLALNDFNGDGKAEMVLTNNAGQILKAPGMDAGQTLIQEFNKAGIKLIQDPSLNETTSTTETVFNPGTMTSKGADINGDGIDEVRTNVPVHTYWQYDPVSHKMDLHGTNVNGTDRILINDATIGSNGQITGGVYDHSIININNGLTPSGEPGSTINIEPPASGGEIWGSAADYRVVHAATEPQAINNFVESTGDKANPWAVTFLWHDKIIHNPNTGADINVSQANQAGQVGMLLQIPHFGDHGQDVAVFIPAHQATNGGYEVHFDPTDTKTLIQLPDGHTATMADISRAFLNNGELTKYVEQHGVGSLGSELTYEGRAAFNLANPDRLIEHQGRILAGVLDPTSNNYGHNAYDGAFLATHAVHGSEAVNLEGPLGPPEPGYTPTIDVENITDKIDTTILGYKIGSLPPSGIGIPAFPVPMRQNVEKSVRREAGTSTTTSQNTTKTPTRTVPPTPEKEKEKPRDELEEIAGAESNLTPPVKETELTDEEKQRFEKMTEQAKKVLNAESKSGKKYSEEVYDQLLREIKKDSENKLTEDQIREYLDQSMEASLVNDKDVTAPNRKINEVSYADDLDTAIKYLMDVCVSRKITNVEQLKEFYLGRLSEKAKKQIAKDPTKREIALHRMTSLATVIKLADEGKLNFNTQPAEKDKSPDVVLEPKEQVIPAIKSTDLTVGKEILGSVARTNKEHSFNVKIGPDQKGSPYEIYNYDIEKRKFTIRKIDPDAPKIILIAQNGGLFEIKADAGFVQDFGENYFRINGQYYSLFENSVLIPVTDESKINELNNKIAKAPK